MASLAEAAPAAETAEAAGPPVPATPAGSAAPTVVVDPSVALAAVTGDVRAAAAWTAWVEADATLIAPGGTWAEMANALVHVGGVPVLDAERMLDALQRAGLATVDIGATGTRAALRLAARHRLTVYDAAFLSLAIEAGAELATLDRALARAATEEAITLALTP